MPEQQEQTSPSSNVTPRYCLGCLYDLRGLSEHRCPECGAVFDPDDPATYLNQPDRVERYLRLVDPVTWHLLGTMCCILLSMFVFVPILPMRMFRSTVGSFLPLIVTWALGVGLALGAVRSARTISAHIASWLVFLFVGGITAWIIVGMTINALRHYGWLN